MVEGSTFECTPGGHVGTSAPGISRSLERPTDQLPTWAEGIRPLLRYLESNDKFIWL